MEIEKAEASPKRWTRRAMDAADAPSGESRRGRRVFRCRGGRRARRAPARARNEQRGPDYKAFIAPIRRDRSRPRTCATPRSSSGCARYLDKQLQNLSASSARLANRLQRRLMAQQNRAWEFDLEEGMLDPGAPVARRHRSAAAAVVQAREGHRFPRHGRDAAARQFRLDARAPDHGRGDLRRHSGAHAGALRRQGRDPRASPPAPGRAASRARSLAAGRQAGRARPAQRSAPHHLQVRRRALAARAQEPRPDDARRAC